LYSIIYGEAVFNDIVSIVLFHTIQKTYDDTLADHKMLTWRTPFELFGLFIECVAISMSIGFAMGCISSLIFKFFRSLSRSPITETLLLFVMALITYYVCEVLRLSSGIISLLTCGITMAHYTWYNLSPQGKTISSVTFSILAQGAEAIVFSYIGICTFTYVNTDEA